MVAAGLLLSAITEEHQVSGLNSSNPYKICELSGAGIRKVLQVYHLNSFIMNVGCLNRQNTKI